MRVPHVVQPALTDATPAQVSTVLLSTLDDTTQDG